jgi:hypothetical protein
MQLTHNEIKNLREGDRVAFIKSTGAYQITEVKHRTDGGQIAPQSSKRFTSRGELIGDCSYPVRVLVRADWAEAENVALAKGAQFQALRSQTRETVQAIAERVGTIQEPETLTHLKAQLDRFLAELNGSI